MTSLAEYDIHTNDMHNLLVAHINCRSTINSFDCLKDYILMQNFDVIGVTETWLKPNILTNAVDIPGYTFLRNDRIEKRGGGVGAYIKKGIQYTCLMEKIPENQSLETFEHIWFEIKFNKQKLTLGVIYKPPKLVITALVN